MSWSVLIRISLTSVSFEPVQGHILGLSHDGDLGAGNSCKKESGEGSVMAPMVAATFSYFHWSSCSAGEYHYKVGNTWDHQLPLCSSVG